jgi:hypothetical protein
MLTEEQIQKMEKELNIKRDARLDGLFLDIVHFLLFA